MAVARAIVWEGRTDAFGTYHFAGAGPTTWHQFAETAIALAAERTGRRPVVRAITTADYPTPTRRPANSVLDCRRIGQVFGIHPRPWRDTLPEAVAELLET